MSRSRRKPVLFVGPADHHEFAAAVEWLGQHSAVSFRQNLHTAAEHLQRGESSPELIILAASRRGMFPQSEVRRLHARAPLARLIALLGSWCEGETRTGQPWPGIPRLYWHQFVTRIQAASQAETQPWLWASPRTATVGEQVVRAVEEQQPPGRGLVANPS